jgi:hypothetical protein
VEVRLTDVPHISTQVVATGLGLVGGLMPVLYGEESMTLGQRAGCVIAGGATAFCGSPLIELAWPSAPTSAVCAAGYLFGMAGIFFARGFMAWLRRAEKRLPDAIDRRTGGLPPSVGGKP